MNLEKIQVRLARALTFQDTPMRSVWRGWLAVGALALGLLGGAQAATLKIIFQGGVDSSNPTVACTGQTINCLFKNVVFDTVAGVTLPPSSPLQRDVIVSIAKTNLNADFGLTATTTTGNGSTGKFDDDSSTTPGANIQYFQPIISRFSTAGISYAKYTFTFYQTGSTTITKSLKGTFFITALDIDGSPVREFVNVYGTPVETTIDTAATGNLELRSSSTLAPTTPAIIDSAGGATATYQAKNFTVVGAGISASNIYKVSTVYQDVTSFTYAVGSETTQTAGAYVICNQNGIGCNRLGAISFDKVDAIATLPVIDGYKWVSHTDTNGDGRISAGDALTWNVVYTNTGNENVTNFQISDLLPANLTFTAGTQSVFVSGTNTSATANALYTGAGAVGAVSRNLLSSGATLAQNGSIRVSIPVTIGANAAGTTLSNQASSVVSINGTNTTFNTDNVDGTTVFAPGSGVTVPANATVGGTVAQTQADTVDATTVSVSAQARIGLAKTRSAVTNNGDGTYSVTYTLLARNYSNPTLSLSSVQVTDSLAGFGTYTATNPPATAGQYTLSSAPAVSGATNSASLSANAGFNGSSDTNLLTTAATNTLPNGGASSGNRSSALISFTVRFRPITTSSLTVDNTATASAAGGVSDVSDTQITDTNPATAGVTASLEPDPNLDGNPSGSGEARPTPFVLTFAPALTPFTCEDRFYLIKRRGAGTSSDPTSLFELDRSGAAITSNVLTDYSIALNALAYNPSDNYLYAMGVEAITDVNGTGYHLYRLGSGINGAIQDLGLLPAAIPQGSSASPAGSWQSAAFDRSGKLHLYTTGTAGGTSIYTIAGLAGQSSARAAGVTIGTLTVTTIPSRNIGDMAIRPNPSSPGNAEDIFLISSDTANTEEVVYQVPAAGGTTQVITMKWPTNSPKVGFGAAFYDASGRLYGYDNNGSGLFTLDTSTGAVIGLNTGPASVTVDGASCPFIAPRLDVLKQTTGATPVGSSNTQFDIPFTLEIKNTGAVSAPNVQLSDNLNLAFPARVTPAAAAPSVSISTAPTAVGCTANSSFNGTSNFNLLSGTNTLSSGATCTVTFTARVTYAAANDVPTVDQLNQAAVSSVVSGTNPGFTFVTGLNRNNNTITLPVPPPLLLSSDLSNNKATGVVFPTSANTDPSNPTPVPFPQGVDLQVEKVALKGATTYTTGTTAPVSDLTVVNAGTSSASYKYVLWIKNNGPRDATNVIVRDTFPNTAQLTAGTLPTGVTVITAPTSTATGVLEWNVGSVPSGTARSVIILVSLAGDYASTTVQQSTPNIVNVAALFSVTQTDSNSANNQDSVTVLPNPIKLEKSVQKVLPTPAGTLGTSSSAKPGDTLEYCVTATSTLAAAREVNVSDPILPNQTFVVGSITGVSNGAVAPATAGNVGTVTGTLTGVVLGTPKTLCFRTTVN